MGDAKLFNVLARVGLRPAIRHARHGLKQELVRTDSWYDTDDTCNDDCILIGGCGRSGTTLLREIINRHSRIAVGPETTILCDIPNPHRIAGEWQMPESDVRRMIDSSASIVRFAEAFFRTYAKQQNKPRWGDKTPANIRSVGRLLTQFPRARFIHIIRDGRDVVCSMRHHPRTAIRHGRTIINKINQPITESARRWIEDVAAGLAYRDHPRVLEVRYEALATDPEPLVRDICEFIGETFEPAMIEADTAGQPADLAETRLMNSAQAAAPVHTASIGRWRRDLSFEERRDVARIAGELLITLGYVADHSWVDDDAPAPT